MTAACERGPLKMRILLLNHEWTITGASVQLFRLARHLIAAGHAVSVAPLRSIPGAMQDEYIAAGIPIIHTAGSSDFDACVGNTICAAPGIIQLGAALPSLWWLHETEIGLSLLLEHREWLDAFRHARAITFQTRHQRDDVYRSFIYLLDPGRVHVIPNGIDVAGTDPSRVAPKRAKVRVVSAGSVEPRKRPEHLIHAAARFPADALELVICGGIHTLPDEARAIVRGSNDRIRLTGEISRRECLDWIASGDLFALASLSESQPLSILEAAALGRPLLLSALRCHADTWHNGTNCLMFPPGDIELLAAAMVQLGGDAALRSALGAAAAATAADYTDAACFGRIEAVLNAIRKPPRPDVTPV